MKGKRRRVRWSENQPRPVAILHVGGMDDDVQEKAEHIDEDMPCCGP